LKGRRRNQIKFIKTGNTRVMPSKFGKMRTHRYRALGGGEMFLENETA